MIIKPLKISNVEACSNLILAPMSGVTNTSFRKLLREENEDALGLVVTEFISIEALTRGIERSKQMMRFIESERPISIQIFGYDIDRMVDAAKMVEDVGAEILDINCGCPVPKVVRRGGGCELMRQPDHLKNIIERVVHSVKIPVTLKIRSGWDDNSINALEIGKMAEDSGIQMLTVHGRTRQQLYRGQADWEIISKVANDLKIPVIGSGDIIDGPSAKIALSSGVSGLMIGRAAIENPFVFKEIKEFLSTGKVVRHHPLEVIRVLLKYFDILMDDVGPKATVGKMKQIIGQSSRRLPKGAEKRRILCMQSCPHVMHEGLLQWQDELENGASDLLSLMLDNAPNESLLNLV